MSKQTEKDVDVTAAEREKREKKLQALNAEYREIILASGKVPPEMELKPTEIEKKWRFTDLPGDLSSQIAAGVAQSYTIIKQGYTEGGVRLREETTYVLNNGRYEVDEEGTKHLVSYKTYLSDDGVDRYEAPEIDIGKDKFEHYWNERVGGNFIEKTRYRIHDGYGMPIDLDYYKADPVYGSRFWTMEVEFKSHQQADEYHIPSAYAINGSMDHIMYVTEDSRFDAKNLAERRGGRRNSEGRRIRPNGTNGNRHGNGTRR
ncbi:MAG: hypothetical protein KGJ07_02710 [Patescibacteria group bacterium]|nr:hypothetical protein [Patescibacteria group bacterium]